MFGIFLAYGAIDATVPQGSYRERSAARCRAADTLRDWSRENTSKGFPTEDSAIVALHHLQATLPPSERHLFEVCEYWYL